MKTVSLALCLVLFSTVLAQPKNVVPPGIAAVYEAQSSQWARGDWKGFFSKYDPSFVYTDPDGKRSNLKQVKKLVSEMVKGSTRRSLTTAFSASRPAGGGLQVSYTSEFTIWTKGHAAPLRYREVATDTWRKTPRGWREFRCVDTSFAPLKASR